MSALPPKADMVQHNRDVRFVPEADSCSAAKIVAIRSPRRRAACGARKGSLNIRHRHFGFNRVGNETILMGGMMHLIELCYTGLSVVAPLNLWA
jgi:hypothetical protein